MAFRLLVGLLHALQPFVRLWGRLRGRPLAPVAMPASAWSGDRHEWLAQLRLRLAAQGCAATPGRPDQPWDLDVTVGPFLVARLTTAVLWHWQPAYRVTFRPRPATSLLVAVAVAAAPISWPLGVAALVVVATATAGEAVIVRSRLRAALVRTAGGAAGGAESDR
jgi:hypothetical protein